MNNAISQKAQNISPSLTLAITAKANKLKAEGVDVVSFTVGEPDFNTPDFIVRAAKEALDKGFTRYTAVAGIPQLRQAICDKLARDNGLSYRSNQIVVGSGAKHSIYNALMAILNDGDEVIIVAPYWLSYPELITLCGGVPKVIETTAASGYKLTAEALIKAICTKTKAIILNSPCNPSGVVYTQRELQGLAAVIEKADIYAISDEIYEKLIYDGVAHYSIASFSDKLREKTIVVNGVSKAYAMTGWRIGYTASNGALASSIDNIQSQTTSNANSVAQHAAVVALGSSEGEAFIGQIKGIFERRRDLLLSILDGIGGISYIKPQGTFYVMVNVSGFFGKDLHGVRVKTASDISELLVEHAAVVTVPCEAFGAPNYIRLSYCLDEKDIKKGAIRLKDFLAHELHIYKKQ